MAMSVNPTSEENLPIVRGQPDPAAMIRLRSTVPIRACGLQVPRQQAGHMTARFRHAAHVKKPLLAGGHPHMTMEEAGSILTESYSSGLIRYRHHDSLKISKHIYLEPSLELRFYKEFGFLVVEHFCDWRNSSDPLYF
jgi:hypothetical protein